MRIFKDFYDCQCKKKDVYIALLNINYRATILSVKFVYLIICFGLVSCHTLTRDLILLDRSHLSIHKLDSLFNTPGIEASPVLSKDGNRLFFRRNSKNFLGTKIFFSDSIVDSVTKEKSWSAPKLFLDCGEESSVLSIAFDTTGGFYFPLLIRDTSLVYKSKEFELYSGTMDSAGRLEWHVMPEFINFTEFSTHPSVTADGKTLYYQCRGTKGRKIRRGLRLPSFDIYVTRRTPDFTWGSPQKLEGAFEDEDSYGEPCISSDGKYLFYTRYTKITKSTDIFCAKLGNDGSWSEPFRLPFPINTESSEGGFYLSPSGKTFYFTSNRDHMGKYRQNDIFEGVFSEGTLFEMLVFPEDN